MFLSCKRSKSICIGWGGVLEVEELLEGFLERFLEGFLKGFFDGVLDEFFDRFLNRFLDGVLKVGDVSGNLDLSRLGAGAGDFEDEALDGDNIPF